MAPKSKSRHWGFRLGEVFIFVAFISYLIGFVAPYWYLTTSPEAAPISVGLWMVCARDSNQKLSGCSETVIDAASWLRGVQFMQVMGLLLMFASCIASVVDCAGRWAGRVAGLELISGCGGIFGLFSSVYYLARTATPGDSQSEYVQFFWAWGLDIAGSILCLISALLLAIFNCPFFRRTPSRSTEDILDAPTIERLPRHRPRGVKYRKDRGADVISTVVVPPEIYIMPTVDSF